VRKPPHCIRFISDGLSILSKIVIGRQFRGPPNSGNGGYVCGVLARGLDGPVTAVLRAPPPLDVDLDLATRRRAVLTGEAAADRPGRPGRPGAAGAAAGAEPARPPARPARSSASAAECIRLLHLRRESAEATACACCRASRGAGGRVACTWTPHCAFADATGRRPEVVWAALDCPGIFAWSREGRTAASGHHDRRGAARCGGEDYVVLAWPIVAAAARRSPAWRCRRRRPADGPRHQVWITMRQGAGAPAARPQP
jgi:hypothetical protein